MNTLRSVNAEVVSKEVNTIAVSAALRNVERSAVAFAQTAAI